MKNKYRYDENILFLLSRTYWKIQKILRKKFNEEKAGVTPDQWLVLLNLLNEGALYQSQISKRQFKDRAAIKRLVDQLEQKKLVERKRTESDLRLKRVTLTEKGESLVLKLNAICQNTLKKASRDLKEVELNALKRLIGRIHE